MCVYLYMHNKYTQYTHIHYVKKNVYFGCDSSFDSTKLNAFPSPDFSQNIWFKSRPQTRAGFPLAVLAYTIQTTASRFLI